MRKIRKTNKNIPLTSESHLKESKATQARINKRRGNALEYHVAKYLNGRRQIGSGAFKGYKGDGEIPLINNPGKLIIECKSSANVSTEDESYVILMQKWFQKLYDDTIAMNGKFGILVVHFFRTQGYYVFMRSEDIQHLLIDRYQSKYSDTLQQMLALPIVTDVSINKHGRVIKGYAMTRTFIDKNMVQINGFKAMQITMPLGNYIVMSMQQFRDIIEDL